MPQALIQLFRERKTASPLLQSWLVKLEATIPEAHGKCLAAILELERLGSEARRPLADMLRDGVRELRIKHLHVNYRILYFFSGRNVIVLSHGLTKKDQVPDKEIDKAIKHMELVKSNPSVHIATWEIG